MFESYVATREDLEAVTEGISAVWRKELNFVFKNKKLIKNVIVISYDSRYLYVWTKVLLDGLERLPTKLAKYNFYKVKHGIKIDDDEQRGWCAGLRIEKITDYLPKKVTIGNYQFPKISGSLLTPFMTSHNKEKSAYTTKESYLATIVHEFGHIYFNQHKTWWYSNKNENLKYLRTALNLYSGKKVKKNGSFRILAGSNMGEIFAFGADYTAATLFWPGHKADIDRINKMVLSAKIDEERVKDLEIQDSMLDGLKGSHLLAMTLGKILITSFPDSWPEKLLSTFSKIDFDGN